MKSHQGKLRVAILGTGKIGTDLLLKIQKSPQLECVLFSGRNPNSEGIKKAEALGIPTSYESIDAFTSAEQSIQLVFDATSAAHHRQHAPVFEKLNIKAVDLTPARVGPLCVPLLNEDVIHSHSNVNMVTCGGQSSIPVIEALVKLLPQSNGVTLHSIVSEDSIGQATLDNIDDYYATTASAISEFANIACHNINLEVAKGECKEMTNIISFSLSQDEASEIDSDALTEALNARIAEINQYVPGYRVIGEPTFTDDAVEIKIAVRGQGDWIPEHAGNLDIINCAALSTAEKYAEFLTASQESPSLAAKLMALVQRKKPNFAEEVEAV